jgi:hypothetical protein
MSRSQVRQVPDFGTWDTTKPICRYGLNVGLQFSAGCYCVDKEPMNAPVRG